MLVEQEDDGWVGEERQASRLTSSFLACLACGGDSDGLRVEQFLIRTGLLTSQRAGGSWGSVSEMDVIEGAWLGPGEMIALQISPLTCPLFDF